jgi:glycosyltransferase involved in cell wall biosynthesis
MIVQIVHGGFAGGAVATRAWQETEALVTAGYDVHVVTDQQLPAGVALLPGVTLHVIHPMAPPRLTAVVRELSGAARAAQVVRTLAGTGQLDLVVCHHSTDAVALRRVTRDAKVPLVLIVHALIRDRIAAGANPYSRATTTLLRWANRRACRTADTVVCVSEHVAAGARAEGTVRDRIRVVPCGVDTETFRPAPEQADVDILFVGRLSVEKGANVLLDALTLLPRDISCVIIGDGPAREALQAQAEAAGLGVRFLGRLGRDDVARWYPHAHVLAVPSLSEPQGMVALEGLASGVPVVASAVGGLSTAIEDGVNGLLVEPSDPALLAEAIAAVLGGRLGTEAPVLARRAALGTNVEAMQERVVALYKDLAATGRQ